MDKLPEKITLCNLEVIVMLNGEIVCLGKTIGWFNKYKNFLTLKK